MVDTEVTVEDTEVTVEDTVDTVMVDTVARDLLKLVTVMVVDMAAMVDTED